MAADSGYHSFSLPTVPHVHGSSETSERSYSFDLQESADGLTSSDVQAIVGPGYLPDISETTTTAIPLITSNTVIKARSSNETNFSRKTNVVSRVGASTKASLLINVNIPRKSRGYARDQKSALPKLQPSHLTTSRDDDNNDQDIWTLLEPLDPEAALAQHFKITVNMTKHLNYALFHSGANHEIKQSVMVEVKALAEEMIYFFDGLQGSFRIQIEEIKDTKSYLPTLGDNLEEHHLEAAIRIWAKRICENVRKPRKSEKHLLESVARAYDANVYNPFLQLRRRDARHNIRELSVHLDSVYNAIEGAIEIYEQIIVEMSGFRQALERAFDDYGRLPCAWFDWWGYQRVKVKAHRHISETTNSSVPSTPTALTDAESDDKAGLSTVTALHAKATKKMARAAGMKWEDT